LKEFGNFDKKKENTLPNCHPGFYSRYKKVFTCRDHAYNVNYLETIGLTDPFLHGPQQTKGKGKLPYVKYTYVD